MKRGLVLLLGLGACASPDRPPIADGSPVEGMVAGVRAWEAAADEAEAADPWLEFDELRARAAERFGPAQELDGLLDPPSDEIRALAVDREALEARLAEPRGVDAQLLAELSWLRDPAVAARRVALEAELEGYDQVRFLDDVVSRFRSYTRGVRADGGPAPAVGPRDGGGALVPYPAIDTLRGDLVDARVEEAWQALRAEVLDVVVDAEVAFAELSLVEERSRYMGEHVELLEELEPVVRARSSTGGGRQEDILVLAAELERRRAELDALDEERRRRAASALTRMALEPSVPIRLGPPSTPPDPPADPAHVVAQARERHPSLAMAQARWRRATTALALAEEMATGALDLGLARRAGDPDPDEPVRFGPAPDPSQASQGPTRALLRQMGRRTDERRAEVQATTFEVERAAASAHAAAVAAARLRSAQEDEVLPLVREAFAGLRGSYAGGGASFLDVHRGALRLLDAEVALADLARDEAVARAELVRAIGRRPGGR